MAEEAAQESFVRAFVSLKKLRKPESFYAWLMGIAGRVLKEQFPAPARRGREEPVAEELPAEERGAAAEYPLEEAIAVLPESYRQVILLRYYEGLSCQEIATHLEMPLGTVTKTLSRAYALLRQELKARWARLRAEMGGAPKGLRVDAAEGLDKLDAKIQELRDRTTADEKAVNVWDDTEAKACNLGQSTVQNACINGVGKRVMWIEQSGHPQHGSAHACVRLPRRFGPGLAQKGQS